MVNKKDPERPVAEDWGSGLWEKPTDLLSPQAWERRREKWREITGNPQTKGLRHCMDGDEVNSNGEK